MQVLRNVRPLGMALVYRGGSSLRRLCLRADPLHPPAPRIMYRSHVQVVRDARPLSKPLVYRGGSNLRRLYEQADMPDRLVVIGDSLCSFNPVGPPKPCQLFPPLCICTFCSSCSFASTLQALASSGACAHLIGS